MTVWMILISLAGLGYLTATDPKRRRTFKQPPLTARPLLWPARLALFGPGVFLILAANWSGLAIWSGAITVLGWVVAALSPQDYRNLTGRADNLISNSITLMQKNVAMVLALASSLPNKMRISQTARSPQIADLETQIYKLSARVEDLETRLAEIDQSTSHSHNALEGKQVLSDDLQTNADDVVPNTVYAEAASKAAE